jgi:hypothetical protein
MKMKYRNGLATFLLSVLVSWPILSVGQTAPDVNGLTRAGVCVVHGARNIGGATGSSPMTVKNDGGWCWNNLPHNYNRSTWIAAHDTVVITPPQHGRVVVGDVDNHRVRVAYQPAPGFTGTDTFTTGFNIVDTRVVWEVTVTQ